MQLRAMEHRDGDENVGTTLFDVRMCGQRHSHNEEEQPSVIMKW